MSTNTTINGQKLEKDNLLFEVLGCLDQCSVEIGSAKLKVDNKTNQLLTEIQKDLANFSSYVAGCIDQEISSRTVAGTDFSEAERNELNWLESQIKQKENQVDIPNQFVLPGKSELEARLNLARVAVRKAERRGVSLNRYQDLPEQFLDYLNRLSWLLFLLSL